MKKFFIILLIAIIFLFGVAYIILFTPPGNNIVKGIIEKKLNSKIPVRVKIEKFKLTPSYFFIKILVKNNSYIVKEGNYSIFSKSIDAKYEIKLIDLPKFEKIINYHLNGDLFTKGILKGDENLLKIKGIANVATSNIDYDIKIKNKKVSDLIINSQKIKIAKLLYFLNLPIYADGNIIINGKIFDLNKGKIKIKISNGKAFAKVLNKEFGLQLKKDISFKGNIINKLNEDKILINANIVTSLANLTLPKLTFNIKDSSIKGNYILNVQDLKKLYDLTQTKLRGNLLLNGTILKTNEEIFVNGKSHKFNGNVDFVFKDNKFDLKMENVNTSKILYMMYYPEMFNSTGNGIFNYDILKEKGVFDFKFKNGRLIKRNLTFVPRTIVNLVYGLTGVDLTRELFNIVNLNGKIDKKVVNANLYLKSKLAEIKSNNSIIDLNKETIKSLVYFKVGGVDFSVLIAGKLNKPSIKLNPGKAILNRPELKHIKKEKKKIEKKLQKKLQKLFN